MFYAEELSDNQGFKNHIIKKAFIPIHLATIYKRSPMGKYFYFSELSLHFLSIYDYQSKEWLFSWNRDNEWAWQEHIQICPLEEAIQVLKKLQPRLEVLHQHLEKCLLVLAADETWHNEY